MRNASIVLATLLPFLVVRSACASLVLTSPSLVGELNSSAIDDVGSLSEDGLTIFLQSRRSSPDFRIYSASRTSSAAPFGPLSETHLGAVNAGSENKGHPVISTTGLELFHTQVVAGVDQIFESTRGSLASDFGSPTMVAAVNFATNTRPHSLSDDGLRLYLSAQVSGAGFQMFVVTRSSVGEAFDSPTALPFAGLNSGDNETEMTLSDDDLSIFFASDRPGGLGGLDIWYSTRTDLSSAFGAPINLTSINSSASDRAPVLWNSELYFSSERGGGPDDIYRSLIVEPVPEPCAFGLVISGVLLCASVRCCRRRYNGVLHPSAA